MNKIKKNKSTKDFQVNKLKLNKEIQVTGARAWALQVSSCHFMFVNVRKFKYTLVVYTIKKYCEV